MNHQNRTCYQSLRRVPPRDSVIAGLDFPVSERKVCIGVTGFGVNKEGTLRLNRERHLTHGASRNRFADSSESSVTMSTAMNTHFILIECTDVSDASPRVCDQRRYLCLSTDTPVHM